MEGYRGTVRAPEFPAGLDWLNTDRPLQLADLKGKLVILDMCISRTQVVYSWQ